MFLGVLHYSLSVYSCTSEAKWHSKWLLYLFLFFSSNMSDSIFRNLPQIRFFLFNKDKFELLDFCFDSSVAFIAASSLYHFEIKTKLTDLNHNCTNKLYWLNITELLILDFHHKSLFFLNKAIIFNDFLRWHINTYYAYDWKVSVFVRTTFIRTFPGPCFPVFGLNTESWNWKC